MLRKDILLRVRSQTQGLELWSSHWQAMPGYRTRPTRWAILQVCGASRWGWDPWRPEQLFCSPYLPFTFPFPSSGPLPVPPTLSSFFPQQGPRLFKKDFVTSSCSTACSLNPVPSTLLTPELPNTTSTKWDLRTFFPLLSNF